MLPKLEQRTNIKIYRCFSRRGSSGHAVSSGSMPAWLTTAVEQGAKLAALDDDERATAAAFDALLQGRRGVVSLALLDRPDLSINKWRRVSIKARLPSVGRAPKDWCLTDMYGDVLDEEPDTPGGVLQHFDGDHSLLSELAIGYYKIALDGNDEVRGPAPAPAQPSPA